mmetsp:Transcript_39357/g.37798  ORF Transcript_39357/g.37798 Transcript_39357/m.37798 type:complete len:100 (-) Transcript_39357:355-654(-)
MISNVEEEKEDRCTDEKTFRRIQKSQSESRTFLGTLKQPVPTNNRYEKNCGKQYNESNNPLIELNNENMNSTASKRLKSGNAHKSHSDIKMYLLNSYGS